MLEKGLGVGRGAERGWGEEREMEDRRGTGRPSTEGGNPEGRGEERLDRRARGAPHQASPGPAGPGRGGEVEW